MAQTLLDRILFVPTYRPPHKEDPTVSWEHRTTMVRRSLRDQDSMTVSSVERELEGLSYTIETLRGLREQHNEDEFSLIVGGDELEAFTEWHEWEAILEECSLLAMKRPGTDVTSAADVVLEHSRIVDVPEINVSSTLIRERFRDDRPAAFFVPESVRTYIRDQGLYQS